MTTNMSRPMKWFETYVKYASKFHRASITASLHTEHLDTREKMQVLADKLIMCQEHDVQVTINMVMVPECLIHIMIMHCSFIIRESTVH